MLSIEIPATIALDVEPEVAGVFESLPVWFVLPVELDEVVLDGVVVDGVELDVDPVLVAPVLAVPVPPEGVEAPVVLPPNAWSTS